MEVKTHHYRGDSFIEYYNDLNKNNTLLYYNGAFTKDRISDMCIIIKDIIQHYPHSIRKKIFAIFIELVQNIAYHSAERIITSNNNLGHDGIGKLIIENNNDFVSITTINQINDNCIEHLTEKCKKINQCSRSELRQYKRKLRLAPITKNNCANIGLVQMSLTSNLGVNFEVKKESDKTYIGISIDISIQEI